MLRPTPRRASRAAVLAAAAAAAGLSLAALAAVPTASAADPDPFVVVGTSDVFDSNLAQTVLEPGFEAAYPQYDFQYVSKGTGAAIAYAQAGTADAMIVHAASLENQFVDQGYSLEQYGRAIFWGDYVLLGPASDPAGVLTGAPHDIATAFEKVAAAGAAGTANFVSRGGTPGTTVQEHAIWALTSGVTTCDVSAANGGGTSPSTTTGACPTSINYPSWYHATGLTQGPNILNASTCNYPGGNCYVLTDRGTFNYLQSTGQATNLQIVTRDNDDTARGGQTVLVNSFHAYGINPAKFSDSPNVDINTAAATAFLNWVTSPDVQKEIGSYLADQGAPFLPSAAPTITGGPSATKVATGKKVKLSGSLTNVVPGTPALAGGTVRIFRVLPGTGLPTPKLVGTAVTGAKGRFSLTIKPTKTAYYIASTQAISQIEDASLDPVFGDLLAPASARIGKVKVTRR